MDEERRHLGWLCERRSSSYRKLLTYLRMWWPRSTRLRRRHDNSTDLGIDIDHDHQNASVGRYPSQRYDIPPTRQTRSSKTPQTTMAFFDLSLKTHIAGDSSSYIRQNRHFDLEIRKAFKTTSQVGSRESKSTSTSAEAASRINTYYHLELCFCFYLDIEEERKNIYPYIGYLSNTSIKTWKPSPPN